MDKKKEIKEGKIGRWIGVKDDELVAVTESYRERYKLLKEKDGVYVIYSPTESLMREKHNSGSVREFMVAFGRRRL